MINENSFFWGCVFRFVYRVRGVGFDWESVLEGKGIAVFRFVVIFISDFYFCLEVFTVFSTGII